MNQKMTKSCHSSFSAKANTTQKACKLSCKKPLVDPKNQCLFKVKIKTLEQHSRALLMVAFKQVFKRGIIRTQSNMYNGAFLRTEPFLVKNSVVDVRLGSTHASVYQLG